MATGVVANCRPTRLRRSTNIDSAALGLQRRPQSERCLEMLDTVLNISLIIGFVAVTGITITLIGIAAGMVKV